MRITEINGEFYIKDGFVPVGGRFRSSEAASLALSSLDQEQMDVIWMEFTQKFPNTSVDSDFLRAYIETLQENTEQ